MWYKMRYIFLLFMLVLLPIPVLADSSTSFIEMLPILLFIEAFVTIHMSLFVLLPLSKILSKDGDSKAMFKKLFIGRIIILFFGNFLTGGLIAGIDFMAVFVGAFIVVPILSATKAKSYNSNITNVLSTPNAPVVHNNIVYTCYGCGAKFNVNEKFCPYCHNEVVINRSNVSLNKANQTFASLSNYDSIYSLSEDEMVKRFIERAMSRSDITKDSSLLPRQLLMRKNILSFIYSILVFVFVTLIFFHFPIYTYIVGIIILVVCYLLFRKYDLLRYVIKEVKSRPSEKISSVLDSVKASMISDNWSLARKLSLIICALLPLFIFYNPKILYEKNDTGYSVRFYIFGTNNFTSAVIPETYKGKPVTSLRGNTFSNMPFLKKVTLPDTITEIRGQAFLNDSRLVEVNIPTKLEYLGGGAFYNCSSIENIVLPDSLTFMGGEVFYHARNLKSIQLSKNLTEIRGNSFEGCSSLTSIEIPDQVTRIGGHAFYENSSLSEVMIGASSRLTEIGSSAFRLCPKLYNVTIPEWTYVNERAFKESPTVVNRYAAGGATPSTSFNYKYLSYLQFSSSSRSQIIDTDYVDSQFYNKRLYYLGVVGINGMYQYSFEYVDGSINKQFTLSQNSSSYKINQDLAISILDSSYFLNNKGYVDVWANYN